MENKNQTEKNPIAENLEAVGQIIVGEIEKIGAILTGDPITNAEGDFNITAGAAHRESNRVLQHIENEENLDESRER